MKDWNINTENFKKRTNKVDVFRKFQNILKVF